MKVCQRSGVLGNVPASSVGRSGKEHCVMSSPGSRRQSERGWEESRGKMNREGKKERTEPYGNEIRKLSKLAFADKEARDTRVVERSESECWDQTVVSVILLEAFWV